MYKQLTPLCVGSCGSLPLIASVCWLCSAMAMCRTAAWVKGAPAFVRGLGGAMMRVYGAAGFVRGITAPCPAYAGSSSAKAAWVLCVHTCHFLYLYLIMELLKDIAVNLLANAIWAIGGFTLGHILFLKNPASPL